jgi:uncharacterized protein
MDQTKSISQKLGLKHSQIEAAVDLIDQGNTLPFIARYRKEVTGGLDEEQLRQLAEELERRRAIDKRRKSILATIEQQGKLTPALKDKLNSAETLSLLEDLYQPYKPKRTTRASVARQRGLQGLADMILAQNRSAPNPREAAAPYINDEVLSWEEALSGARDIVAETISDHPQIRQRVRQKALRWSLIKVEETKSSDDPQNVFQNYYDFQMRVDRLRPHHVLAINRGETKKVLRVKVEIADRDWRKIVNSSFPANFRSPLAEQLKDAIEDGAKRLLLPAIVRDVRRTLTETAEQHAITVFATNLRGLLNQPPLSGYKVLGIDPGLWTGCKLAVVDPTGNLLETGILYLPSIKGTEQKAHSILDRLVHRHAVTLIAIGNGTGSRESEQLVAGYIQESSQDVSYLIADEAGASVYSASKLAREELPDLDVTLRGAVSIARRVQDPLAELVKIDPRSIGVGLYQHDVNQGQLSKTLAGVVESVVNQVGVAINTASISLLTHVAGVGAKLAENIVAHRNENGPFKDRQSLRRVPGMGPKTFEQAAGFLRIRNGSNSLDASAIHPESYTVAKTVLQSAGTSMGVTEGERKEALELWHQSRPVEELASDVGSGVPTLVDIIAQLGRPGRDPRKELPTPVLRKDVLSMEDLKEGMRLQGTVRNVVDFGAFVDIGLKDDGLLHRSQWGRGKRPAVGDVIEVLILRIEPERHRIALTWPD